MVEDLRPPDHPAGGSPPNDTGLTWLWRTILAVLGLTAVIDYLRAQRPEPAPPPPVAEPRPGAAVPILHGDEVLIHPDGRVEHPGVRHERTDASFRWVLGSIIAAMIFAAVVNYILLGVFYHYSASEAAVKKSPYPLAPAPSTTLPAGPRLEQLDRITGLPTADAYVWEADKDRILYSYGAQTPDVTGKFRTEKGYVHVPIGQAMDRLANKLPVRKQSATDQHRENGLVDAGASNSGRMFRRKAPWYEP